MLVLAAYIQIFHKRAEQQLALEIISACTRRLYLLEFDSCILTSLQLDLYFLADYLVSVSIRSCHLLYLAHSERLFLHLDVQDVSIFGLATFFHRLTLRRQRLLLLFQASLVRRISYKHTLVYLR